MPRGSPWPRKSTPPPASTGKSFARPTPRSSISIRPGCPLLPRFGTGVLLGTPVPNLGRRGQPGRIDIDDRGVGRAKLFPVLAGGGVDFLGHGEPLGIPFRQADQFFQPGSPGGLHMNAGVNAPEGPADRRIEREFV